MACFQVASDLHINFLDGVHEDGLGIEPAPGADALILAGDIGVGTEGVQAFADWPVPVFYVPGNHESYGDDLDACIAKLREAAVGTSVRVLDRDAASMMGVRILGCTMWTDYKLHGEDKMHETLGLCGRFMRDHHVITRNGHAFRPEDALECHERDLAWLSRNLGEHHDGATVVITHHGVHPLSVHEKYRGSAMNPAFHSDLGDLLHKADVWIHGHTHNSLDYTVGKSRVLCNPRGYPRNPNIIGSSAVPILFENAAFSPALVVIA